MRIIKLVIISVIFLSLIVIAFSLILPSQVRVSRSITIHESETKINRELRDLEKWKKWNVLLTHLGKNTQFSENKIVADELFIQLNDITPIRTTWIRNNQRRIDSGFNVVYSSADTTHLQWYFDFQLKWYPWEKFQSLVFDKQLGQVMEQSLDNLKAIVEDSL